MDEVREKRVRSEVDRISNLPEALICQVLLNLPTKDVVKTSVLSHRWKNLWKHVQGLDLDNGDFAEYKRFVSFVDSFLGLNSEASLQRFKLKYKDSDKEDEREVGLISRWLNTVVSRKLKRIDVCDESCESFDFHMPTTLYTYESLVSLKLCCVTLPSPKCVSLPSLKVMDLEVVDFANDLALETLISRCPVLEKLIIGRCLADGTQVLRVRSQSLLSFSYGSDDDGELVEEQAVAIDAPKLKYLSLNGYRIGSFILNNMVSLVEADITTDFNLNCGNKFDPSDLPKRNMIRNFLRGISIVKKMNIASSTLKVFYDYARCERLPLFTNLSSMSVYFSDNRWEMLPIFLESCPNLKSLVVESIIAYDEEGVGILSGPRCLLPSLEYVEIKRPLKGVALEMKLVSYILENSKILKKLTLCLDDSIKKEESVILKELLTIPRYSISCQVVVL